MLGEKIDCLGNRVVRLYRYDPADHHVRCVRSKKLRHRLDFLRHMRTQAHGNPYRYPDQRGDDDEHRDAEQGDATIAYGIEHVGVGQTGAAEANEGKADAGNHEHYETDPSGIGQAGTKRRSAVRSRRCQERQARACNSMRRGADRFTSGPHRRVCRNRSINQLRGTMEAAVCL